MTKISEEIALEFSKILKSAVSKEYEVMSGDNLWDISQKFDGVSVEDIKKANPGIDPSTLQVGQMIIIPEAVAKPKKIEPQEEDVGLVKTVPGSVQNIEQLEQAIKEAANVEGIPLEVLRGLVAAESSGNPQAAANRANPAHGALGLTQLSPFARSSLGITDPYDIKQNLAGGARWLKTSYKEASRLKGTSQDLWIYALMIYHAGMSAVQKWIDAGSPGAGFGQVGPKTIKYPKQVFLRGRDPQVFSVFWPKE